MKNPPWIGKPFLFLKNKNTLSVIFVLVLTVGFLVTYMQFQKQQDIRQQAAPKIPPPKRTPTPTLSPTATTIPTPTNTPTPTPTTVVLPTPTPTTPSATPSPTPIPVVLVGDINGDGKVNVQDLSYMLAPNHWGTSDPLADLNHSGKVDVFDLSILLTNWKP